MADHNFLTDTYDSNTAILDECKAHIAEIVLPSEPASQFDEADMSIHVIVQAINSVLPEVSQLFEGQAYMYRFAKKGVCIVDGEYAPKFDIEDIHTFKTGITTMLTTMEVAQARSVTFLDTGNGTTISSSLKRDTATFIAAVKISDYITQSENGVEYNNDAICKLFTDMKCGTIPEENYYIVEKILLTCVSEDGLNTDEIEFILNSSKNMVIVRTFNEEREGQQYITTRYNKGLLYTFWARISKDFSNSSAYLFECNKELLNDPDNCKMPEYQKLININALFDIITAYTSYTTQIESNCVSREQLEDDLQQLNKGRVLESDGWYDGTCVSVLRGLVGQSFNPENYIAEQKQFIANFESNITINYEKRPKVYDPRTDTYYQDLSKGTYYTIADNSQTIAFVYEFSENTNRTLESAKKVYTAHEAEVILQSFKYNVSDYYTDADDYVKKNTAPSDYVRYGYDVLESLPLVGDYVAIFDDVSSTLADGAEYLSEIQSDENNDASATDTINGALDISKDFASDPAEMFDGDKAKSRKKGAKSVIKIAKVGVEAYQNTEDLKKEYEAKKAYDEQIDQAISDIKYNGTDLSIDQLIASNVVNRSQTTIEKRQFSFTVYADGRVVASSNAIDND